MNNKENFVKNKSEDEALKKFVTDNEGGNFGKYAIVAIAFLLIGIGLGWYSAKTRGLENQKTDNVSETENEAVTKDANGGVFTWPSNVGDVLTVPNQAPGLEVKIDKINTPKSVWVAIHEDSGEGQPGNILGAQLFDVGMASGTVELLRGTEKGQTYYAMIHDDNGDRAFIPKMDTPIVNASGGPIMVIFKTTGVTLPTN